MFGGAPHAPPAAPPPPQVTDPAIQQAANQARLLARKRGGRAATILQGSAGGKLGDVGSVDAPQPAASLLGG